ncbi:MAG TPA: DUF2382 domain-containing protein [Solirubrobacteraceae bacterium]|jgi:Domain of unknown function (DUF2382)/PRC-barrel domain|nr:DUF2382 domain-containing protein [Solirubrobacteraceae bacterium]
MSGLPDIDTALAWRGRTVRDQHGEELGKLGEVYLDAEDDRPAWAAVTRGLLKKQSTIIPLDDLREGEDGDLHAAFERARFERAPDVDPDVALSEDEERALHEHYGRPWDPPSGEETDTAMTRSEEEVDFSKQTRQRAERVRLKKVLVEDEATETVPVRKEVIRLETEPAPDGRIESVEDIGEDPRS